MRVITLITFLMLSISSNSFAQKQFYQMPDLEVLSHEKNFNEFFKHALDIKPSKRDKKWKELVQNMGQDYLDYLISLVKIDKSMFETVRVLSNWPIFKNNEFFIKKRDQIFIKELSLCFKEGEKCLALAQQLYNDFNHENTFDFYFTSALFKHGVDQKQVWKYAQKFVKRPISEFYCNKSPLKEIVTDQVYQSLYRKVLIKDIAHIDCLKSLSGEFKKGLLSSTPSVQKSSYLALKQTKIATKDDEYLYSIINFLNNKTVDVTELDQSIKTIKILSKDYKKRESLLQTIKKFDPLPGGIFNLNNKSNVSKTKLLSRYFPEIIDNYAHTCLTYLRGTVTYPNGNPTPECHEFFSLSRKIDLLPASFIKEYDKATYFLKKRPL